MAKAKKAVEVSNEVVAQAEVKTVRLGIGQMIIDQILNNPELSNKQILDNVLAKFEQAKTSMACIAWYKSKLRAEGRIGARTYPKKVKAQEAVAE